VEGVYRFLGRVWRLFVDEKSETQFEQAETTTPEAQRHGELLNLIRLDAGIQDTAATPAQLKALHACIKKVTEDLDGMRFNTAISAMMMFVNEAMTWNVKPVSVLRDFLILLHPFAPHLAFWLTHYAGTAAGLFTLSSGGGKTLGTEGNVRQLQKLKPDILIGVPTFIYHLLQQAVEQGARCENLRRIVLGGEKVSDGLRQKLRDLAQELGARDAVVLATYGFTEAKLAWAECPFPHGDISGGYHLYPDLGIMEVVDPQTGASLPPGHPGELVFTPLDARGTVILRYRTGDCIDGGLTGEPCPHCGRTLPRLVGNISRRSEVRQMQLDKIKGTLVDFNELEHVLDDVPQIFGPTLMMPGQSFRLPFQVASSYPFTCTAHASGQLMVIVEPMPETPWARLRWRIESLLRGAI
jgi:hypothetical protein